MEVKLPSAQEQELYSSIQGLLLKAVDDAQKLTGINNDWIKGRKNACKYLQISDQTLTKFIDRGLKYHLIDDMNITFFSKKEISEFLRAQ
ncbi:hypothetical protein FD43_GL000331 [Apilactobacillus kunkeei DSM 12361 = ATCC 700308]|jgi:hypothetical protein|uniref:Helix-turn-helix domain-containing protein n=1 Tax=Apilactobacillus kunkeei DSM 12361 = ATCC 700308 TaxID=1423768 RepID=A0A0R1FMK6_9LACO|nr:hypothetical protein [Apilactobacillus kunkeei]KOY75083.1 hypothetical protein RZ79_04450 [Apilactobacillus kunkeei DSM 12361 = ATCC 700308]KRK23016.1 hypothetical protein FD43_GL000331 [Apilactobacillus kunkeei DSM 12361 = ATCC 700308]MCT6858681.1 hypothetical protein [Apilactobacillus sp.]QYU53111.1 hypothetical protein K2W83_00210 [Apilactobacillus kunkeei]